MLHFLARPQWLSLSPLNRKILIAAASVNFAILMFDDLLEIALWLWHNSVEILHTLFEVLELTLDRSVEHLFDTGLHATQVIVFYVIIGGAAFAFYKLYRMMLRWFSLLPERLINYCIEQKYNATFEWEAESLLEKTGTVLLVILGLAGLAFLIFM